MKQVGAAQAAQRFFDFAAGVFFALELQHLAPQHFVAGVIIADDFDAPHIHRRARIDGIHKFDGFLRVVGARVEFHQSVGEAQIAQGGAQNAGGFFGAHGVVNLARLLPFGGLDLVRRKRNLALESVAGNGERLALVDAQANVDARQIRRKIDLRRIDRRLQKSALEIIRANRLQIPGETAARIQMVVAEKRKQAARREIHSIAQIAGIDLPRAFDFDALDRRLLVFDNGKIDIDAIARQRRRSRFDIDAIKSALQIRRFD